MASTMSPLRPAAAPSVSSPLAGHAHSHTGPVRPQNARKPSFPPSRALRPFPSIAHSLSPSSPPAQPQRILSVSARTNGATVPVSPIQKKPATKTKIIEPPKNFKTSFVLNMTQAEFSRQD